MGTVNFNPCDKLERPRIFATPPRGLTAEQIRTLLHSIAETPVGLWDKAIVLTLTLTGRRRNEVIGLTAGDLETGEVRAGRGGL